MSQPGDYLGTVLNALDDAIEYREPDNGSCPDCTTGQMCADHAGDKEAADEYRAVRQLLEPAAGRQQLEPQA